MCRCCQFNRPGVLSNMNAPPVNRTQFPCECEWRKAKNGENRLNWVAMPCDRCMRMFHRILPATSKEQSVRVIDVYGNKYTMAPIELRADD